MKCLACDTFVYKIPISWKCPHCGEKLPDMSKWEIFRDGITEYLQEKGVIFWTICLAVLLFTVGLLELFFGTAHLLGYIGGNLPLALGAMFFGGMLIDMVMKIVLPLKMLYGSDFVIRERASLRNIRKITVAALIAGVLTSLIWAGPLTFLTYFPAYLILIGWWLALAWSIVGLFIDPRWLEDVRFRTFIDKIGITSLKRYRKISTVMIGILVVVMIGFNILLNISALWIKVQNIAVVGTAIKFSKAYLGWLF
jgi:hypothetical protein